MTEKKALFTIFGATGDLAKRKLFPSLFKLFQKGILNEHFAVIGTARREWTKTYFESVVIDSIADVAASSEEKVRFASHFYYQSHDVTDKAHYVTLKKLASVLTEKYQTENNKIFYLAMSPDFFGTIVNHLKSEEIINHLGFERLIIEKPFGSSLETAQKLNQEICRSFDESQIYRIDHYLGKEMIQNISAVRFANILFKEVWNNQFIDNIQITFAEKLGVEDRGGYYDHSGALKDMVQNHILQVLSLLAMDQPSCYTEAAIRQEKIKALKSIKIFDEKEALENFIPAQYVAGEIDGNQYISYQDEPNVNPASTTETFAAGKFEIDNPRWKGVPFFFRTGKRLTEKGTRINIVFKTIDKNIFSDKLDQNVLTIYIQPTEGFSLTVNGKEIGQGFDIAPLKLSYRHDAEILGNSPEAYEKLILDTLNGDSTNFSHWDEVEVSWRLIDVIRASWDKYLTKLPTYQAGTMGPTESFELLKKHHTQWLWQPDQWYRNRGLL
ncbi:MAG: glucose-6-phosphate dehydrogenase [Streptococcaceae bacterium]|jgi:glucose-6-phosphate 1-dehydrogenase|nr:glucose-6-phosphate dehydrogenase [Streptococcaceae bacterium]